MNDDFKTFSIVNRSRAHEWHKQGEIWTLADWSNALCGEAGELANIIKKIRRLDTGTGGRYEEQDRALLVLGAKTEIADVVTYADLLLEQLDPSARMMQVLADKFNNVSDIFGFPHKLT